MYLQNVAYRSCRKPKYVRAIRRFFHPYRRAVERARLFFPAASSLHHGQLLNSGQSRRLHHPVFRPFIHRFLFSVPPPRQQVLFAVFGSDKRNLHDRIRLHVHAVQISDAPWTYVIRRILRRHADTVHGTKSRVSDFSLLYRKTGSRSLLPVPWVIFT